MSFEITMAHLFVVSLIIKSTFYLLKVLQRHFHIVKWMLSDRVSVPGNKFPKVGLPKQTGIHCSECDFLERVCSPSRKLGHKKQQFSK